jgi:putative FmdB family regulatory protein
MPIHEYACDDCGSVIEVIRRLSDAEPTAHDGCGGALRRLISAPSVRMRENDGLTGSSHSSILRADDNYKAATGKSRKPASMALPSARRDAGAKPRGK